MVRWSWKVSICLVLVLSSAVLCLLHILLFRDAKTLFFYLFLDIVFVPVQVLLVTVIIEKLLNEREKQAMMKKLNMVIGAFFSEAGTGLMLQMKGTCLNFDELRAHLSIRPQWPKGSYRSAKSFVENYECRFGFERSHLNELHEFLVSKRPFVLALLQNPNLLEHDAFTSLLWAVCHLTEELDARAGIEFLPPSDVNAVDLRWLVGCGAGFPACQFAEGRLESLPHTPLSQQHCPPTYGIWRGIFSGPSACWYGSG